MPKIDREAMDPALLARLRRELNGIRPRPVVPRYVSSTKPIGAWRLAPAALAVAFSGILALAAFAATGSPNPVVWTQRVQTVINPPAPTPTGEGAPATQHEHNPAPPKHDESPEPSERPEPAASPEPRESPKPGEQETSTSDSGDGQRY